MKRAYLRIVTFGLFGVAIACAACASILSIETAVTIPEDAGADVSPASTDASLGEADATFPPPGDGASPDTGADSAPVAPPVDATADANPPRDAGKDAPVDAAPRDTGIPCNANLLTPIAATSSPDEKQAANGAIDGLFSTRWESAWALDPQWIYIDFQSPVFLREVDIIWESACAADYQLQVSNNPDPDSGTWTTIATVTGNSNGNTVPSDYSNAVTSKGLAGVGRYLRVFGYIRCEATYGYSIWEMRAYGDTNATCTP